MMRKLLLGLLMVPVLGVAGAATASDDGDNVKPPIVIRFMDYTFSIPYELSPFIETPKGEYSKWEKDKNLWNITEKASRISSTHFTIIDVNQSYLSDYNRWSEFHKKKLVDAPYIEIKGGMRKLTDLKIPTYIIPTEIIPTGDNKPITLVCMPYKPNKEDMSLAVCNTNYLHRLGFSLNYEIRQTLVPEDELLDYVKNKEREIEGMIINK